MTTTWMATILLYLLVGFPDVNPNSSPGRTFTSVRCPSNGRLMCGIDPPRESHEGLSRGQCNSACNRVNGCNWLNYVEDGGRRLCQLYDRHPHVGYTPGCTLFMSSTNTLMISTHNQNYTGTLMQQHYDDSTVLFDRTWNEFKVGFGDVAGNYWIGNDQLHSLTTTSGVPRRLRVDLQARYDCQWYWAEYSTFSVGTETDGYRLTIGGYTGNAGDAMTNTSEPDRLMNGMQFTTSNVDNAVAANCFAMPRPPSVCPGGFWYNGCTGAHINRPLDCEPGFSWLVLPFSQNEADQKLHYSRLTII